MISTVLGHEMLSTYDIWKKRCDEVAKLEIPGKKRAILEKVRQLLQDVYLVEARDRSLSEVRHVPIPEDSAQKMRDWMLSVEHSKESRSRIEQTRAER